MIRGYVEFEFDLPEALLARLVEILDGMPLAPLNIAGLVDVPETQGVYQLFLDKQLVYIGKTDAEAGLRHRLERHHSKTLHRKGLDPARISFKAVRIYVFTTVDLEARLIRHYGGPPSVMWNGSGFGSNDPGIERDTTRYKKTHFDAMFPIDIDQSIELTQPVTGTAATVFSALKLALPYTFRFQSATARARRAHPDLEQTPVTLPGEARTARQLIEHVVRQLPPGWQATMLPSHVILYKNDERTFPHGAVIARSPA